MSAYATLCLHFRKVNLTKAIRAAIDGATQTAEASLLLFKACLSNVVTAMFELEGIDHIALGVRDIERSATWYVEVLGFERRYEGKWNGVPTFIGLGETAIALFPRTEGTGLPRKSDGILHFALRASRDSFVAAQGALKKRGISFEFQDHEISHSIYFRDPDGYVVEITTYEIE